MDMTWYMPGPWTPHFKKDKILATRLLLNAKKSLFSCFEISNLVEIFYNSHFGSLFNFHYIFIRLPQNEWRTSYSIQTKKIRNEENSTEAFELTKIL
jgi:hypothetical protein